ncbi:MAG: tRNA pseudouridine(38-40) synthase TruA [Proteobacteria bacterium]|jgi:tRNA pseudouridine38-40 synthase|nr:tRNA pseudouridine(38-40) synthase TruA [Pseudomonadota bacterium]
MRIALGIEYDGTDFFGWQRLTHGPTVQGAVEAALSDIADAPVQVVCAGRTDAGVHARCQVIHFDTQSQRTMRGWTLGPNSRLPASVAVRWAREVSDDFHARFSARARRYRYTILNRSARPALDARYVCWERSPLDAAAMHAAAQLLLGENDFSAFRTVACQARSPQRCVQAISVAREGDRVVLDIQANAFLHHMVRNIAGSLRVVGRGEQPPQWIAQLLAGRDRSVAGPTSAAQGLVFLGPLYPAQFGLPADVSLPS